MLRVWAMCLSLLLLPVHFALAEECPLALEEPVLITSVGQNFDALIIKTIFDDMGIEADFQPMAEPSALADYKQVVVSPGISYKGMVALGTTFEKEFERAKAIIKATQEYSRPMILMYLGGFTQGDAKSQELVELVTPHADVIIIYRDSGGPINYFLKIAREKGIPVYWIDNLGNLCEELTLIFSPSN